MRSLVWPLRKVDALLASIRAGKERRAEREVAASCSSVGAGLHVEGEVAIENDGELVLGSDVTLRSRFAAIRLMARPGAKVSLGDGVAVGFGSLIAAKSEVRVGAGTRIGPYVTLVDYGLGDPDQPHEGAPDPIVVGADVDLGARVTVLKGTRLGDGCRVVAGSVVGGEIPPNAIVVGNPARVVGVSAARLVHEALQASAVQRREAAAVRIGVHATSYAELWRRVEAIAERLLAHNATPGQPVLFMASDRVEFIAAFYACSRAGKVAVPVADGAPLAAVQAMAAEVGADTLLVDAASVRALGPNAGLKLIELAQIGAAPAAALAAARVEPQSPALIMFTSGTTAKKKAVLLSHQSLLAATRNINAFTRIGVSAREFVSIPLHHSFGLGRVRSVIAVGGCLVFAEGPLSPASMVAAIEANNCNVLSAVPAGISLFSGRFAPLLARIGARIELVELGSAFMSRERKAELTSLFPKARICMHYGLTEASRSTFLEFRAESSKLNSVGRPSPNVEIRVLGPAGEARGPDEEGEIAIRGEHVTSGYFGDAERTRSALRDGWFHTGDYGFLDRDGYLSLIGRKDDMINSGGIKISPLEVEEALRTAFPELETGVVGVPDPAGLAGHVAVVAYVSDHLASNAVLASLTALIEKAKLPRFAVAVAALPRTENGKLKRAELAAQIVASGKLENAMNSA
ncbi:MAG: AMP-binding protein [Polyangiaceae bacterium]